MASSGVFKAQVLWHCINAYWYTAQSPGQYMGNTDKYSDQMQISVQIKGVGN